MLIAGHRPNRAAWVGLGAQLALAGGLLIYVVRTDWIGSETGIFTLIMGSAGLVAGSWLWWLRASRVPIIMVDAWLGTYGAFLVILYGSVDRGGAPRDETPLVLGADWLVSGLVGAYAVWRSRPRRIRR